MQKGGVEESELFHLAKRLSEARIQSLYLQNDVAKFNSLLEASNTPDCDKSNHADGKVGLHGRWCYELGTSKVKP